MDFTQGRLLASVDIGDSSKMSPQEFIPRMSPFMLRVLLFGRKADLVSPAVDAILDDMFHTGAVDFWSKFEKFHALYECLRHTLLSSQSANETTTVMVKDLYPDALVCDKHLNGASILQHKVRMRPRSLIQLKHQLPRLTQDRCAQDLNHVVLAGIGNAGFDIAVPIEQDECVLIEARFSKPEVKAYVDIQEAVEKRELILKNDAEVPGACVVVSCLSYVAL